MSKEDVKNEGANPTQESNEENKPETEASEGVKTPDSENVPKDVYEKVKEAMKKEREAKREEKARVAELEERLAKLETRPQGDPKDAYQAKTDLLFLMNKDPFLKENLDLVEAKMQDNPSLDVRQALTETKAEFFDRIQKEAQPAESNQNFKQEKPSLTKEPEQPNTNYTAKSILKGEHGNLPPEVIEAYKRTLG